jgi:TolB-like protein
MFAPSRNRPRMRDSRLSGLSRRAVVGMAFLVVLLHAGVRTASAGERMASVAVFPVENLTGGSVSDGEVRQFLIARLGSAGIKVLDTAALDDFMTRHRVRYAAGIDGATAESLRQETGVDGVVIASFEASSAAVPPKVALVVRLVSVKAVPTVVWADDAGMAGDDSPGFFELGVVNDYRTLLTRALDRLTGSLVAYLKSGEVRPAPKAQSKFRPKTFFRGFALQPGRTYSVAVVPFFNLSERRNAGEILALLFIRHLSGFEQFHVADTGATRRQLLDARVIMDGGLSISDADTVAALIEADFVLAGRVLRYEDYEGPAGRTRVEFSAVLIEKKSRRVVWSSDSANDGTDSVRFFERGTSRTAHTMATQMVRLTIEMIGASGR